MCKYKKFTEILHHKTIYLRRSVRAHDRFVGLVKRVEERVDPWQPGEDVAVEAFSPQFVVMDMLNGVMRFIANKFKKGRNIED